DLWGKKRFAYHIEKQLEGFYVLYTFKLDPAQVKEMERLLSLKPQVIRQMVVNLEEK
ncbi:MAG: 30S ribosomal protein S6, partial [Synergistaceae bacterium]